MIHKDIEKIINQAFTEANNKRHEFFTSEHLLLSLCEKDTSSHEALEELDTDVKELINDLQDYLRNKLPKLQDASDSTVPTETFLRIIERATTQRHSAGKDEAYGIHIIISMMEESDSYAVHFLKKQGVKKLALQKYASRHEQESEHIDENVNEEENPLTKFCSNLNELAEDGHIDDLIGRDEEIERTIQVLCRRRKNNPILVGEAGVGKTAIAEGLAKRIVDGEVPEVLANVVIYSVDLGSIVAGSKYRGDFEQRIKSLVNTLSEMDNVVIFIDEIHTIIGAGSTSDGTLDASNLLKPGLSSGALRCIGATTYKEYKDSFEKNAALARRFQKVDILEPSKSETVEIVRGLLPQFEKFHKVKYAPNVIEYAVDLADKYIYERHFPDKAIDLIDEAGAKARIQIPPKKRVNNKDIEHVLAKITKMPETTISSDDKRQLKTLDKNIQKRVFGQDTAITAIVSAIKMARAGLKDIDKPIGSFLFTGPTGVGKTEVSKCLASEMGMKFLRFDMSEYVEAHSISRLIGSPPGYVGHDGGGLLTEAVHNSPHCVLLLDEIEKAHPDIYNVLLQIMDYGKLTDSVGKIVNFSNVILIMTSNAGASDLEKNVIGFSVSNELPTQDSETALKRQFTPEFRNRLSDIITFKPLSKEVISNIIDKFIGDLNEQLTKQNIHVTLNKTAKEWLLDNGHNPLMGARPMGRLIDRNIKQPLSEQILFGDLKKGGKVTVSRNLAKDGLDVNSKQLTAS